jgi:NhaA family Na+:H+ antiporter
VRFLEVEAAGGFVLMLCTGVALVLTNSQWAAEFARFWKTPCTLSVGGLVLSDTLGHWVNDGLMAVFFFVVGLEIKRELVAGELRDPRKAALPIVAALGGMVMPAALYLLVAQPAERPGWGVPMATDIAFVVGILALLGRRVPNGLKILLLSLAIVDDIGAVLVIAVFYTAQLQLGFLGLAAAGFAVVVLLNLIGVRRIPVYFVIGIGIWLAFLKSGVHPTVAGVLLGLLTPASAWVGDRALLDVLGEGLRRLRDGPGGGDADRTRDLGRLQFTVRESVSPLERLERGLHPWVAFIIMPVFALANAGVVLRPAGLGSTAAVAVIVGLVLGKPLGIVLFSWAAVRVGLARLPGGVNWKVMVGVGCVAGIGFTMSLFIAGLAFDNAPGLLDSAKIGVLAGSAVSAVVGCTLLLLTLRRPAAGSGELQQEVSGEETLNGNGVAPEARAAG